MNGCKILGSDKREKWNIYPISRGNICISQCLYSNSLFLCGRGNQLIKLLAEIFKNCWRGWVEHVERVSGARWANTVPRTPRSTKCSVCVFIVPLKEPGEEEISVHLSQIQPLRLMEGAHLPQILHLARAELGFGSDLREPQPWACFQMTLYLLGRWIRLVSTAFSSRNQPRDIISTLAFKSLKSLA